MLSLTFYSTWWNVQGPKTIRRRKKKTLSIVQSLPEQSVWQLTVIFPEWASISGKKRKFLILNFAQISNCHLSCWVWCRILKKTRFLLRRKMADGSYSIYIKSYYLCTKYVVLFNATDIGLHGVPNVSVWMAQGIRYVALTLSLLSNSHFWVGI